MECYRRIPLQSPFRLEFLEVSYFEELSLQRLTPKSFMVRVVWGLGFRVCLHL